MFAGTTSGQWAGLLAKGSAPRNPCGLGKGAFKKPAGQQQKGPQITETGRQLSTYCVLGPLVPPGVGWCLPPKASRGWHASALPLGLGQEGTSYGAHLAATPRAGGTCLRGYLLGGPDLDQRAGHTNTQICTV